MTRQLNRRDGTMLQELLINACVLVTILFGASQLFKDSGLSPKSPLKVRLLLGLTGGISASILIYFSIHVNSEIILDFRHLIEILAAIFGGLLPVAITGIITAIFRLIYYGVSTASVVASIGVLIVCIGCGVISTIIKSTRYRLIAMFSYTMVVQSIIYYFMLKDKAYALQVILAFILSSVIVGLAISYLVRYLVTAHRLLNQLKEESSRDFLTGLCNTRQFDHKYNLAVQNALEKGQTVSMLIVDIDHFKRVNDTCGHAAGDEVLRELGELLLASCRAADTVSRIGGEEFAVLLVDLPKLTAVEIAERIRSSVEAHPFAGALGKKLKLTVSVGVAVYPETIDDIHLLKETADNKLYEAKRSGRNRVCI